MRGLRGCSAKLCKRASRPMSGSASGKYSEKKLMICGSVLRLWNVLSGAKRVHVKDLSCTTEHESAMAGVAKRKAHIVGKGNEHELVSRPDVQMMRVQTEGLGFSIAGRARWNGKLEIAVIDIVLGIVHPEDSLSVKIQELAHATLHT